ncbi:hypothetical protein SAMN04487895_101638 [Paenibacillus sophorae]|uniref:Uncharacterized protein n=1 Tax=Paenibacillus sophorae TaxID=1333845 RepID=A0A1H8GU41_9BACL|nr:hypothetical protein [Paenibacillus sophorae]QWU14336.1 hypothetical protein KP014_20735 [Paenibacillus sophorae]SEN47244.1 hypothetical protein SAMN04487895_101638 [Paenibacillus sophorae]
MKGLFYEVGDRVELFSHSYDSEGEIEYGDCGVVIDEKSDLFNGCYEQDLRVEFDNGYEAWVPAEDFR